MFKNPRNTGPPQEEEDEEEYSDDEEEDEEEYSDQSNESEVSEAESSQRLGGNTFANRFSNSGGMNNMNNNDNEPPPRRSMSPMALKIRKKELLMKLQDAKNGGYRTTGPYDMGSDLDVLEAEFGLYEKTMIEGQLTDMMHDGLMYVLKGLEYMNSLYKPGGVDIAGLSEHLYDRKDKLEHVLKRLAIKYSGGTEMPPELSLLFIIAGAIFMTHVGNQIKGGGGGGFDISKLSNMFGGDGLNSLMSLMGKASNGSPQQQQQQQQQPMQQPQQQPMQPPNMKPPSSDVSDLLNVFGRSAPTVPAPNKSAIDSFRNNTLPKPQPLPVSTRTRDFGKVDDDDRFSVSSGSSGYSSASSASRSRRKKTIMKL